MQTRDGGSAAAGDGTTDRGGGGVDSSSTGGGGGGGGGNDTANALRQYWDKHFAAATVAPAGAAAVGTPAAESPATGPPPSSATDAAVGGVPAFASPQEDWIASPEYVCDRIMEQLARLRGCGTGAEDGTNGGCEAGIKTAAASSGQTSAATTAAATTTAAAATECGSGGGSDGGVDTTAARVLVVGCGTSRVSELMHSRHGFRHVTSADISAVAVDYMREHCPVRTLTWVTADCTALQDHPHFVGKAGTFDVAIDKGTADTLLFRSKRKDKCGMLQRYMQSCAHCVRPGTGLLFVVSPRSKLPWLHKAPWFLRQWVAAGPRQVLATVVAPGDNLLVATHAPKGAYLHAFRRLEAAEATAWERHHGAAARAAWEAVVAGKPPKQQQPKSKKARLAVTAGAGAPVGNGGHGNSDRAVGGGEGRRKLPWQDRPCFDFQRGVCARGGACRFSHAAPAGGGGGGGCGGGEGATPPSQDADKRKTPRV